jgi:NAD(P)-dependent dehydrogenase (short-subunit alcohol dehydrogenase family)
MKSSKPIALVTGGSRGIGLGIAQELAKSGFEIAINGRREAAEVADAIASIEKLGAKVVYCRGDVTSAEERQSILAIISGDWMCW